MKYRKQIEIAKKEGLNITQLQIANEVESVTLYNSNEEFEVICGIIYENYLDADYSILEITTAVDWFLRNGTTVEELKTMFSEIQEKAEELS